MLIRWVTDKWGKNKKNNTLICKQHCLSHNYRLIHTMPIFRRHWECKCVGFVVSICTPSEGILHGDQHILHIRSIYLSVFPHDYFFFIQYWCNPNIQTNSMSPVDSTLTEGEKKKKKRCVQKNSPLTNKYQETLTSYYSETVCPYHVAPHVSNIMLCASFQEKGHWNNKFSDCLWKLCPGQINSHGQWCVRCLEQNHWLDV